MSWLFNGLPLHPLIVHAAVVAIPLTALLAIGAAWIARVRDWLGIVFPLIASAATVATLLAQESGEALAEQIVQTSAVTAHTGIAEIAVVAAALLLVVSWAQWVWIHLLVRPRREGADARVTDPRVARGVSIGISAVQTAVAIFAIVAVVIVGDTGARAVWLG